MRSDSLSRSDRSSDAELVQRIQRGEEDAFALLFNAHKSKVYSVCLRMTGNATEAEDLTQDAFLQVFRRLATFRGESALSTWLYRLTVNTVLMHVRKKRLRELSLDEPMYQASGAQKGEHGEVDGRLTGSVDRIVLKRASYSTRFRDTNTTRSHAC